MHQPTQKVLTPGHDSVIMAIPGGPELYLVPALFLLAFLGLVAKYVLKWFREGYERGAEEEPKTNSSG